MRKQNRLQIALVIILSLPLFQQLIAQNTDNQLWTTVNIKKKFSHGIALTFEEKYKLREQFSKTDKLETTIDLSWKPLSFLKGGIAYCRLDYNHPPSPALGFPSEYWELRHRYLVYLAGSWEAGPFSLSLKEKYQQTYLVGAGSTKVDPINVLRSKLDVFYNIKGLPVTPFTNVEYFYSFNEPNGDFPSTTNMLAESRYAVGLKYGLFKNMDIDLGYLYYAKKSWKKDALGPSIGGFLNSDANVLTLGFSYDF
ncbi:MAG TPA: DUF2490 domain-containing protein [Bacteroidales bacterium]|nr:DUF2490 domain-containing protein [Bacteroidales bacterium]